ncbi:MAG: 3-methyl-2-oxobutanoate hydroxymethyltransferase [Nanoarchaeota archaeon]|nr:3-methyl-2-oxobutanoate hydroxymethyltransferase [Nanoarchaeota archaeon]
MKKTVQQLKALKGKEKLSMLTCYDYSFAKAIDGRADILLVGDSLGNVVLGFGGTQSVTMEDVLRHTGAVRRGAPETFIVGDLPFKAYENAKDAIANAKRLLEAGADAVKPEGKPDIVKALTDAGIPTMAHIGLLPQTAQKMSVVGRGEEGERLMQEAKAMEQAGAFSLVLETVPATLAKKITTSISIPTIGIGAGKDTDGQVLVLYDLLGLFPDFKPKFVRQYARLANLVRQAAASYSIDVKRGDFPSKEEWFE